MKLFENSRNLSLKKVIVTSIIIFLVNLFTIGSLITPAWAIDYDKQTLTGEDFFSSRFN